MSRYERFLCKEVPTRRANVELQSCSPKWQERLPTPGQQGAALPALPKLLPPGRQLPRGTNGPVMEILWHGMTTQLLLRSQTG